MCIQAHEKVVLEGGLTEDHVHDAVRIAATLQGAAMALEIADVLPRPLEMVAAAAVRAGTDYDRGVSDVPSTVPIPADAGVGSFLLGRTPVTNREYAPFVACGRVAPPAWWTHPDFCSPLQPVVGVSWAESSAYCAWLSESADGLWRLPTETEWERAARGGLRHPRTAWGETIPAGEIPEGPLRGPWEAGRGTPNGYGLLDMGTIVHEWCLDWREPARPGLPERRASRGGSWRHAVRWSSPDASSSLPPGYRYSDYGFRVLQTRGRR